MKYFFPAFMLGICPLLSNAELPVSTIDTIPNKDCIITVGNITRIKTDTATLRQQTAFNITNGFTIIHWDAYFSIPGSVHKTSGNTSLGPAIPFIIRCVPGSIITFDNIVVKNSAGEQFGYANPPTLIVIEKGDSTLSRRNMGPGFEKFRRFISGNICFPSWFWEKDITIPAVSIKDIEQSLAFLQLNKYNPMYLENVIYEDIEGKLIGPLTMKIPVTD